MENGNYLKDIPEEIWVYEYFRHCVSFTLIQKFLLFVIYSSPRILHIAIISTLANKRHLQGGTTCT